MSRPPHAHLRASRHAPAHPAGRHRRHRNGAPAPCRASAQRAGSAPPIATELANVLALLAEVDLFHPDEKHLAASRHPVVRQLQNLPETGGTSTPVDAIFRAFRPHLGALPWRYSYDPRPDAPGLGQRMAWAELVGPIAPFHSDRVCLGLTAIGPGTLYPAHLHPAVETYLVVSGAADWTANGITRPNRPAR